jgi:putative SOS response-associated peptidase YedK
MCFYVNIKIKPIEIKQHFVNIKQDLNSYNSPNNDFISAFEKPSLPLLLLNNSFKFQNHVWGLIPDWAENNKDFYLNTLNAREETLLTKPSFREYIDSQRGILPINSFYEWHHNGKNKTKFHISHKNEPILNIGVVYHQFANKNNESVQTFSIVTQKANKLMEKIHNTKKRMPLIIPKGEEEIWLSKELNYLNSSKMIHPIDEDELIAISLVEKADNTQISLF